MMKSNLSRRLMSALCLILIAVLLSGCQSTRSRYEKAQKTLESGDFEAALTAFEALDGYEDSPKYIMYIKAIRLAEGGDYATAIASLETLSGFRDSDMYAIYYSGCAREAAGDYLGAESAFQRVATFRDGMERMDAAHDRYVEAELKAFCVSPASMRGISDAYPYYDEARLGNLLSLSYRDTSKDLESELWAYVDSLIEEGTRSCIEYARLLILRFEAQGMEDTEKRTETCDLRAAQLSMEAGDHSRALTELARIPDRPEVPAMVEECKIAIATGYIEAGAYADAIELLSGLTDYDRQPELLRQATYELANEKERSGDIAGAYELLCSLGDYADCATRAAWYENRYASAEALVGDGAYDEATQLFLELKNYGDAATQALAAQYAEGEALLAAGDYEGAIRAFEDAGAYPACIGKEDHAIAYATALLAAENGEYDRAIELLTQLGDYSDAAEQAKAAHRKAAEQAIVSAEYASAEDYYRRMGDAAEADRVAAYAKAVALEQAGAYGPARTAYVALETYLDSEQRAEACGAAGYAEATQLYADGDVAGAHDAWAALAGYGDSAARAAEIEADYEAALARLSAADYAGAIERFTALGNYSDSVARLADAAFEIGDYSTAMAACVRLEQTEELKAREYSLAQACSDSGDYESAVRAYEVLGEYELSMLRLPVARYSWAAQLCEAGSYAEAAEQFALLGDYSDSAERERESRYLNAQALLEAAQYTEAGTLFAGLGSYSDSADMARECDYRRASALADAGSYEEARALFGALVGYSDSADRYSDCSYRLAEAALQAGAIEEARDGFEALGSYGDSAERVKQCLYMSAQADLDAGDYATAQALYDRIPGYSDADDRARQCRYLLAQAALADGDEDTAIALLGELGTYMDSEMLLAGIRYDRGMALLQRGSTEEALRELSFATVLPETRELLYGIGRDRAAVNDLQGAIETLWLVNDYEPASALLSELGSVSEQNGDSLTAFAAYCPAGDEASAQRLSVSITPEQLEVMQLGALAEERGLRNELRYRLAACRNALGDHSGAYALYRALSGYRDADAIIETDEDLAALAAAERAAYLAQFDVGQTVTLGRYGDVPIEWLVLEARDDTRIMISVKGLDAMRFNLSGHDGNAWETSYLRSRLNEDFYEEAFSEAEKAQLTSGVTGDMVYLLSAEEAEGYWEKDSQRVCLPTKLAKHNGADTYRTGTSPWWLRSPGRKSEDAACVDKDGSINTVGYLVYIEKIVVRPVIVLKIP